MYWSTDTEEDMVSSLEAATDFFSRVATDPSYWKWFIISLHCSAQGSFALALDGGNTLLVQKPGVTAAMLTAHEKGETGPNPHMDNFLRLYKKIQVPANLRSGATPFNATVLHDQAISSIDDLRDGFSHFNSKSWSIEIDLMLNRSLVLCEVIDFVVSKSNAILWHNDDLPPRAKVALDSLQSMLRTAGR